MPHSAGITDPVGYVLAYVPVALAVIGMVLAFLPAVILFVLEVAARPRRGARRESVPAPELEARPAPTSRPLTT